MGGNALQAESIRLPAARYREVEAMVVAQLAATMPGRRIRPIVAYGEKADFGDLDVLIEGGDGYDPAALAAVLDATECVRNGDVTSIGLPLPEGVFQVDLIKSPLESFDFAENYFGYNDFGNLVGRVGHKFGAKFGHLGLLYPIRDPENGSHLISEVPVTTDFDTALSLLGYDAARYREICATGQFRTLEDIFRYVVSTPYANRSIYLLDNRSRKARIRDAKRATYNAFLVWLENQPEGTLPAYPWGEGGSALRDEQKAGFLQAAFARLPQFKQDFDDAMAAYERGKRVKLHFNGAVAAKATGLAGKALGELMARVRNSFADDSAFECFFLDASLADAEAKFVYEAAAEMAEVAAARMVGGG